MGKPVPTHVGVTPKRRSGTQWGDAEYAAKGYGRLTLRLPASTLDLLAVLAHERGVTRAQLVAELIEAAGAPRTRQPRKADDSGGER